MIERLVYNVSSLLLSVSAKLRKERFSILRGTKTEKQALCLAKSLLFRFRTSQYTKWGAGIKNSAIIPQGNLLNCSNRNTDQVDKMERP
jgi:hypothetical protein